MKKRIEYSGAAFALIGTAMLAFNAPWSGWGFVAYLVSNVCWIAFARFHGHHGLLWQNVAFIAFGLLGIYRWLIVPPV